MQVYARTKGGGPRSLAFCRAFALGELALCATVLYIASADYVYNLNAVFIIITENC